MNEQMKSSFWRSKHEKLHEMRIFAVWPWKHHSSGGKRVVETC